MKLVRNSFIGMLGGTLACSVWAGHRIETDITYVYRPVCTNNYNFPEDPSAGGNGFCYSIQRTTGTPLFATAEETIAYGEAAPWGTNNGFSAQQPCTRFVDGYISDAPGWRAPYWGSQNLIRNYERTCQLSVPTVYKDFFAVVRNPVCPPGFAMFPPLNDPSAVPTRCVREVLDCEASGEVCVSNPIRLNDGAKVETAVDAAGFFPVRRFYRSDQLGWRFDWERSLYVVSSSSLSTTPSYISFLYPNCFGTSCRWVPLKARVQSQGLGSTELLATRPSGKRAVFFGDQAFSSDTTAKYRLQTLRDGSNQVVGWSLYAADQSQVETYDMGGKLLSFASLDGAYRRITYAAPGLNRYPSDAPVCAVPASSTAIGKVWCVTDHFGRQLNLSYGPTGALQSIALPNSGSIFYEVDGPTAVPGPAGIPTGRITTVTYLDGKTTRYFYGEPALMGPSMVGYAPNVLVNGLTGREDESGVRVGSYSYSTYGFANSTAGAVGANAYAITYTSDYYNANRIYSVSVRDPISTSRTYSFSKIARINSLTRVSEPKIEGGVSNQDLTYDTQANVSSRTDFNNNKVCYAYDLSRNLETRHVEGLTSSAVCSTALSSPPAGARVISTQWHPDWRLETRISEPKKLTTITYNGQGATCAPSTVLVDGKPPAVVCTRTEQATTDETGASGFAATVTGTARTWRYTYTTYGRVLTATDPNNRTTTYSYHPDNDADLGKRGNVASITNAANHTTHITNYNAHGQPTRIVDPNGVVTVLTYDPRLRLTSRTVGNEATLFGYDPVGQMTSVNLPDGARLTYTYDAAHRLTAINDHKGNRIDYTLDAMGNRTAEQMKDPAGVLVGNIARVIDALNRVERITGVTR